MIKTSETIYVVDQLNDSTWIQYSIHEFKKPENAHAAARELSRDYPNTIFRVVSRRVVFEWSIENGFYENGTHKN